MNHSQVTIIAEAGVNHNGSLKRAKDMVRIAAECGADFVKFQTFRSEQLASRHAEKAGYQKKTVRKGGSQLQMLKRLELSPADFRVLQRECEKHRIGFLSTPFDHESLRFLIQELRVPQIKFSSGDLTNGPLLFEAARQGARLILSSGMATVDEIDQALAVIAAGYNSPTKPPLPRQVLAAKPTRQLIHSLKNRVSLLHCTTEYPAPLDEVNLLAIPFLQEKYAPITVGYSDHTEGNVVSIAAVALGAKIIEKHFTLSRRLKGPDHRSSLEPDELAALVRDIRNTSTALGHRGKHPTSSELANVSAARKSLVAARPIKTGDIFSPANLTVKRPGHGLSPILYWSLLGQRADRSYREDELIVNASANPTIALPQARRRS
ncbi:N-acetylneuraminate synthase [Kamptonema cortianum]|nr:N-acetylneuraminate synthase [Oscillatoria laete-virens]MDK3155382.1 N-acetylneuraminate synthase [Kamptonema cortianum]MDL5046131.1 N-acetylneuraminate synthase [Oscillatoria amoena NRMC-F 0135]MDL5052830.1 N-acetylneuraminate synthase [Oscillatoria laete-virens NRMC-F 0139]